MNWTFKSSVQHKGLKYVWTNCHFCMSKLIAYQQFHMVHLKTKTWAHCFWLKRNFLHAVSDSTALPFTFILTMSHTPTHYWNPAALNPGFITAHGSFLGLVSLSINTLFLDLKKKCWSQYLPEKNSLCIQVMQCSWKCLAMACRLAKIFHHPSFLPNHI